jgi:Transcription activator MBF2
MSWGVLEAGNLVLFDQFFHQKALPSRSHIENYDFSSTSGALITAIHVTDLTYQQDGGKVKITCGGVGYTFVKFQTVSECNKQLLLNIEIFGGDVRSRQRR